ncbi:adult-specific rigid cuticular protein 15.7 [Nephila pilipes]|uniref:Adult-specific rigid cuticular protein 15.7 n=1 Tax=Nephila pilipes TaxID=299642 RepID=A0A8X6PKW1_NEPPI|nr:adult-specific rigid cuticular protein 15.7 [Nephila pilipes]
MIAKIAIFFAAFAAVCANPIILSTGVSSSGRQQDAAGNYAFNYGIADGLGATNSRTEIGDALGNKKGTYTITDIDGRARRVDYVADSLGFRTSVNTNEPGTALSAPAAAAIVSPYAPPVAPAVPAVAAAAPVLAAAPLASAPLLAAAPALALPNTISSYSTVVGHGATLGLPLGAGLIAPGLAAKTIFL